MSCHSLLSPQCFLHVDNSKFTQVCFNVLVLNGLLFGSFFQAEGTIKQLEEAVAGEKMASERLSSKMQELHLGMRVKEEELLEIRNSKEMLEKEIMDLSSSKLCLSNRLEVALNEIKRLEDMINMLIVRLRELDSQSLAYSEKFVQLNASFDACLRLAQHEKELAVQCVQQKFDQTHDQCLIVTSERNSLQLHNDELHAKVLELQKEQEFVMVQHADECRLAEEKVRNLESEAETLLSKQNEMQAMISTLEENAKTSLENSRTSDQNTVKAHQCILYVAVWYATFFDMFYFLPCRKIY